MRSLLGYLVDVEVKETLVIHDYVQLIFSDGSILSIYNKFTCEGGSLETLANRKVISFEESDDEAKFVFSEGRSLVVSLRDEDYVFPEAMKLDTPDGRIVVWN